MSMVLAVVNSTAMNMRVQIYLLDSDCPLNIYQKDKLLDHIQLFQLSEFTDGKE